MEQQIRWLGGDYECFSMPYWDWGYDTFTSGFSVIFDSGLSGPGRDSDNCVTGDYFDETNYETELNGCLKRTQHDQQSILFATSLELVNDMLHSDYLTYTNFRPRFEGLHSLPHITFGGDPDDPLSEGEFDFSGPYSPYDPLFFLHHSYVDFLWAVWQDCLDYDQVHKSTLDSRTDIYDGDDLDEGSLDFNDLHQAPWSWLCQIETYGPSVHGDYVTARNMHNIRDWSIVYDKGSFWTDGNIEGDGRCASMNDGWFIQGTSPFRRLLPQISAESREARGSLRKLQQDDSDSDYVCRIDFEPCNDCDPTTQHCVCDCHNEVNPFTCRVCNQGSGCGQCENGFFKLNYNHQCISCDNTFGDSCMFCQDFNGCGQCKQGYNRVYSNLCDVFICDAFSYLNDIWKNLIYNNNQLTFDEKLELFNDYICEAKWQHAIDQGWFDEKCDVPNNFEDCSDMTLNSNGDIDITLDQLLAKPGVAESPCLQEIRRLAYYWASNTGRLLDLCNGFWDPQC